MFNLILFVLEFRFGRMANLLEELCGNMSLTEGEKVGLTITKDATADLRLKGGKCLIGRLSSKRRIQKEVFRSMMARLWKTMGNVVFKELHENLWLFEFSTEGDKLWVKEGRPWLFDWSVLVLQNVDETIPLLQMDFHRSPIWVQVRDMPLVCMNPEVGIQIGKSLGVVEEVDVPGDGVGWRRCLSIRVIIDLTKPLDWGRALLKHGKSISVTFRYEKLPIFCFKCGRIFHGSFMCDRKIGFQLNEENSDKHWGMWLRADNLRYRKGGPWFNASVPSDQSGNTAAAVAESPSSGGGVGSTSGRTDSVDNFVLANSETPSMEKPLSKAMNAYSRDFSSA